VTAHAHARDARLSTPSTDLCACGAVRPLGGAWLGPTPWEPPPVVPPPPPPPSRPTVPLPLLAAAELVAACRPSPFR
jgi:hypothetical protein